MRHYNFGAGPAMLPEALLEKAGHDLLEWNNSGMGVTEVSHRTKLFDECLEKTEQTLRKLLEVPANYQILFMMTPARAQFALIPMNLIGDAKTADYLDTGLWSRQAREEAERYCDVNIALDMSEGKYTNIAPSNEWQLNPDAAFCHYCANETINGVEFFDTPETGDVPLVVDLTSTFLTKPLDVSKFGLLYAGAQKNIGPAGLTMVIIRDDLLDRALPTTPSVYNYKIQAKQRSRQYTPNAFAIYFAGKMFEWIEQQGGLTEMAERSDRKSQKLYHAIDSNDFYNNPVEHAVRSRTNVPFTLANPDLDGEFLKQAAERGLLTLKGHRWLGGMRASLYNALPEAAVDELVNFMDEFSKKHA